MSLFLQSVRVATGSPDETGCLVFDSEQKLITLVTDFERLILEDTVEVGR